ncbi:shikimate dehydrogenase [Pelagibacterium sediminicola]|uniref:shikimate dehydrogenase n=1 Tax=Pelagibacterium sediminicola TaxID=2248761 RepID=UPI000E31E3DC|nr:shikimate dehydrogenase [Pelagibacterium sediminicola]
MTIKAFVIGHPIAHSRSPLIHGTWLTRHGIDGSYEPIDVAPEGLWAFIDALRKGAFVGGNATIPHKEALVSLCDAVDPLAEKIGAVNTLTVSNGRILGSNSDYLGFLSNLDATGPGWDENLERAIVLGAGGASRAILAALEARKIPDIVLLNRNLARAESLAAEFGGNITPAPLDEFARFAPAAGLVVNTSAVGMGGTRFEGLDLGALPGHAVVNDIVYTPLVTPLLADAKARGLRTVDGLGMLLYQAVPGFAAWFGTTPEVTPGLRAIVLGAMGQ